MLKGDKINYVNWNISFIYNLLIWGLWKPIRYLQCGNIVILHLRGHSAMLFYSFFSLVLGSRPRSKYIGDNHEIDDINDLIKNHTQDVYY